ncbi:MAG: amidohydrolase family protein [Anaerolineae bacterium]
MRSKSAFFGDLRSFIETLPVIDCHDHTHQVGPKHTDVIQMLACGYFPSDLQSISTQSEYQEIVDAEKPLEERWPLFETLWKRTCHTGYAQVTRRVMEHFYGEKEMTLAAAQRMQAKLLDLSDPVLFDKILQEAGIAARLLDVWPDIKKVLNGTFQLSPRGRLVISLPAMHGIRGYNGVQQLMSPLKLNVTTLDEYLDGCLRIFKGCKEFGAVAFKDQSAYERTLAFQNPTKAEAEAVFNWFMADPRRAASYPDGCQPLDDYLFHCFMNMARDLDLPVQIHTGHMAGIRNDIVKTNAIGLTNLIELHRDTRFDIFHANWPYSGELLYLGKNYPNVTLDFCWANIIDPIYCQNLFKQVLSSVPHGKVHGYGSDYGGAAERAWAHASIARDNIAIALADMVEMEYLGIDEAKEVAYDWLFGNANRTFRLGL